MKPTFRHRRPETNLTVTNLKATEKMPTAISARGRFQAVATAFQDRIWQDAAA
jgi:hypothetical protein